MKSVLIKKIITSATLLTVIAQPLLLSSCKEKNKTTVKPADYGSYGSDIAREIALRFPDREAYTDGEKRTGEYIEEKIKELGYTPEVLSFQGSETGISNDYIVRVEGTGFYCEQKDGSFELEHRVAIIGTHYDASLLPEYTGADDEEDGEEEDEDEDGDDDTGTEVTEAKYRFDGISDNASGTACILTALKAFKDYKNVGYDVWFVFFGAGTDHFSGAEAFYQSLSYDERGMIDVMYDVDSLYAGDKVYASSGFKSLISSRRYEMRRKLYQSYDVCFANPLWTNYGFDLYYNESGIKEDVDGDGYKDIFKELPKTISDYKVFDDRMIPVVYFESYEYNFTSMDQMRETKNLSLQDYGGIIRGTPADCSYYLDSILLEEDYDRNDDGEIDCSGDRLQIRINCVAFIVIESLLKGSDKGMTPAAYEAYKIEQAKAGE
ncbi:MAG: M28 family peptidase [Saccharofermentans sp.]|nr:M28 family peptidase [Saccharofermentans sp.]